MSYLLDTDFVIDCLNERTAAAALLPQLARDGLAISIITHSEIYEGIYGGRNPRRQEAGFRAFLQGVRVLGVTRAVSKRHAQLRRALRQNRHPVDERAMDLLIAATAIAHDLTLVTSNTRDYQNIPDLKLLNPRT